MRDHPPDRTESARRRRTHGPRRNLRRRRRRRRPEPPTCAPTSSPATAPTSAASSRPQAPPVRSSTYSVADRPQTRAPEGPAASEQRCARVSPVLAEFLGAAATLVACGAPSVAARQCRHRQPAMGGDCTTPLDRTRSSQTRPTSIGARRGQASYPMMALVSRYSSKPSAPHSRPLPDRRYPPKGALKSGPAPFRWMFPVRMRRAIALARSLSPEM